LAVYRQVFTWQGDIRTGRAAKLVVQALQFGCYRVILVAGSLWIKRIEYAVDVTADTAAGPW